MQRVNGSLQLRQLRLSHSIFFLLPLQILPFFLLPLSGGGGVTVLFRHRPCPAPSTPIPIMSNFRSASERAVKSLGVKGGGLEINAGGKGARARACECESESECVCVCV